MWHNPGWVAQAGTAAASVHSIILHEVARVSGYSFLNLVACCVGSATGLDVQISLVHMQGNHSCTVIIDFYVKAPASWCWSGLPELTTARTC
jgi:hypothetical protein